MKKKRFITDPVIIDEIQKLVDENDGVLMPEAVVESATPEESPLHKYFTWDDTAAAHKYRMEEARGLLQIVVRVIERPKANPIYMRVVTSLTSDRSHGGGYRLTTNVLSEKDLRAQFIQDALDEMRSFRRKYEGIIELVDVFAAMAAAERRLARRIKN